MSESTIVKLKIADHPALTDLVELQIEECSWALLFLKISELHGGVLGAACSNWCISFHGQNIKAAEKFVSAINQHSAEDPIFIHVHPDTSVQTHINVETRTSTARTRLKKYLRVHGTQERVVRYDTPYHNNIRFGEYVPYREGYPMDNQIINLDNCARKYQTEFGARQVAYLYAALFYEQPPMNVEDDMQHPLHKFTSDCFAQMMTRSDVENCVNVIIGQTQLGKGKELTVAAVMNIFLGKDSLVFVRNINGSSEKIDFTLNLRELSLLFNDYCQNVLLLDLDYYGDLLESINIYEGTGKQLDVDRVQRPFVYCERLNPSKIEFPFKKFYKQGGIMMYSIFVNEGDEPFQSIDATRGKTENALYNIPENGAHQRSIYYDAFLAGAYTATPCPILTSKPQTNMEDYRFRVVEIPLRENYKGYDLRLPEDRQMIRKQTAPRMKLSKRMKEGKSDKEIIYMQEPGIQDMVYHMKRKYQSDQYQHVSGLIACPAVNTNDSKSSLAKYIVEDHEECPIIAFADCMNKTINLHFKKEHFTSVTQHRLQYAIKSAFNGNNERYKKKHISIECSVNETGFSLQFSKSDDKTVRVMYDIARMIYELESEHSGIFVGSFIISTSFAMGNRGAVYKPSDHLMPLTHMYASEKSANCCYAADIKQIAGRLAGIDNFGFKRYLFATEVFLTQLEKANRIDADLVRIFSGAPKTYEEAFRAISPDCEIGKIVHHIDEGRLTKRKIHEEIAPDLKSKIPRLEIHEYNDEQYGVPPSPPASELGDDEWNDDMLFYDIDDEEGENEPESEEPLPMMPSGTQAAAVWFFLVRYGNTAFTASHIYDGLVRDGYFSTNGNPENKQYMFMTDVSDDERNYVDRVSRALLDLINKYKRQSEIDRVYNENIYEYTYHGPEHGMVLAA